MKPRPGSRRLGSAVASLAAAVALAVAAERFYALRWTAASATAALLSLLLCCAVVYLSAPHLLRWGRQRRWHLPWNYRVTAQGLIFVVAVVAVGSTALSSGNNLIYLVLSSMLAAILLSGLVSRLVLSGLQLQVSLPANLFAGRPFPAEVRLRNLKKWLPSFSLWIGAPAGRQEPAGMQLRSAYCPMIGGGGEVRTSVEALFPARGSYRDQQVWLRTLFPFGFVERRARLDLAQEFVVYPNVESNEQVEKLLRRMERQWRLQDRGNSHDLYRIRPALPEDGARFLDWKAAARAGGLWVREYTREDYRRARLLFDRTLPSSDPDPKHFERSVQFCAAVAWRLHQVGVRVDFTSDDFTVLSETSEAAIHAILRYLALVRPLRAAGTPDFLESATGNYASAFTVVIGGARSPAQSVEVVKDQFSVHSVDI